MKRGVEITVTNGKEKEAKMRKRMEGDERSNVCVPQLLRKMNNVKEYCK